MAPGQEFFKSCSNKLTAIKRSFAEDEKKDGQTSFLSFCRENLLIILLCISLFSSVLIGCIVKLVTDEVYDKQEIAHIAFPGTLFLNTLKMMIIPLMVSSLMAGMASLDRQASGKFGAKAIIYYLTTTTIAVIIGIVVVCAIQPGKGGKKDDIERKGRELYTEPLDALMDLFRNMVPPNIIAACFQSYTTQFTVETKRVNETCKTLPGDANKCITYDGGFKDRTNVLGLVVFSCIFGVIIGRMGERGEPIKNFIVALMEATMQMVQIIIWFTPIGVFFLLLSKILGMENPGETVRQLGWFSFSVMFALAIHAFIVLPSLFFLFTKKNPLKFLMGVSPALMTAFATASSSATLPVTLTSLEQNLNIDRRVTRFVIPIGATINMDGTALYEAVAAVFIAQLNGDVGFGKVLTISITATLASIGAAGIPQAGIVTLVVVLQAAGLPLDDITLIFAIDWFLDRCRTTVNVWGDSIGTGIIYEHSKEDLKNLADPFEKETMRSSIKKKGKKGKKDRLSELNIHMVVMPDDDNAKKEDAVTLETTKDDVEKEKTGDKNTETGDSKKEMGEAEKDDTKNNEGTKKMEEDTKNDEGDAAQDTKNSAANAEDSCNKESDVDDKPKDLVITIDDNDKKEGKE